MAQNNAKRNSNTSKGKRKIEIKKIEDRSSRLVAFSKRRNGVFKKAGELAEMCGADVAVIVRSQAGRIFSHGSVDAVVKRFEYDESDNAGSVETAAPEKTESGRGLLWWGKEIDGMGLEELFGFKSDLEGFRNGIKKQSLLLNEVVDDDSSVVVAEDDDDDRCNLVVPMSSDFKLWGY